MFTSSREQAEAYNRVENPTRRLRQGDHWPFALDDTPPQGGFSLVYPAFGVMTASSGPHVRCVLW